MCKLFEDAVNCSEDYGYDACCYNGFQSQHKSSHSHEHNISHAESVYGRFFLDGCFQRELLIGKLLEIACAFLGGLQFLLNAPQLRSFLAYEGVVEEGSDNKAEYEKNKTYGKHSLDTVHKSRFGQGYDTEKCKCLFRCGDYAGVYQNRYAHLPVVDVLKTKDDKSAEEKTEDNGIITPAVQVIAGKYRQENKSCHKLHYHVSWTYPCSAGTALSSENKPAEYGDKVITLYLRSAGHAVGVVCDEGFTLGESVDAHVQKASDGYSEQEYKDIHDNIQNGLKSFDVKICHVSFSPLIMNISYAEDKIGLLHML